MRTLDLLGGTRRMGDTGEDARPHYEFDLNAYDYCMKGVRLWLAKAEHRYALNVAGPRESKVPGIYAETRLLLLELFS